MSSVPDMAHFTFRTAVAAAGTAVLLTGCASSPAPAPSPSDTPPAPVQTVTVTAPAESPSESPASEASPSGADLSAHNASALTAIATAQAATEGVAFNLDWTRNRWEVELIAGNRIHEVYLSADGTTITKQESERAEAEDRALLARATVPMADAITTAVATTPDAMLVEADLETRRGDVAWEIHTGSGADRQRIFVNAVTGAVM